jgi:signal transduction histidine kinase
LEGSGYTVLTAAALIVSSLFKRRVALPIVELADVARTVSQENNYAVRATPSSENDEIALLVDAFDEMLAQTQLRDEEVREAHDELENRVTERTRELVATNRELETFSYSVSHDLRGPIDALNGFTCVLLKEYGGKLDNKGKELIEHIKGSGRRMMQLVGDLLNLSRVTSSSMQREPVDLSTIARSIAEELCQASRIAAFSLISRMLARLKEIPASCELLWKTCSAIPGSTLRFIPQRESNLLRGIKMESESISFATMEQDLIRDPQSDFSSYFNDYIRWRIPRTEPGQRFADWQEVGEP